MNLKAFFNFLFPNFDKNQNLIDIMLFVSTSKKPYQRRLLNKIDNILEYLEEVNVNKKYHIFFRCPELFAGSKRGLEEDCCSYSFLYAELDTMPKDRKGNILATFTKEELLDKLHGFTLPPSVIVDSGHGYHAYWRLEKRLRNKNSVRIMLSKLQEALFSDPIAVLLTQLLRVPTTYNIKNLSQPLEVKIVYHSDRTYSVKEICSALNIDLQNFNAEKTKPVKKEIRSILPIKGELVFDFSVKPAPLNIEAESFQEVLHILKRQNMFLCSNQPHREVGGDSFTCCFHAENNPSANIYTNKNRYYYYKCFGCDSHFDIFGVCQESLNKKFSQAAVFLCNFFGIKYSYNEWVIGQWEKYHQNAVFTEDFKRLNLDKTCPYLYKALKGRLKYLSLLNQYGLARISSEKYSYNGENLFFLAAEYFAKEHGISYSALVNNLNFLVTLGMIDKIDFRNLPPVIIKRAIQESGSQDMPHRKRITNFFTIPNFFDRIGSAEKTAKTLYRNGVFNIKNCINKTALIHSGGLELATQVFHDNRNATNDTAVIKSFNRVLEASIREKGFATKKEIISRAKPPGRLKLTRNSKEKVFDRCLPLILESKNLMIVRPNQLLRDQLGLKSTCSIILPRDKSVGKMLS